MKADDLMPRWFVIDETGKPAGPFSAEAIRCGIDSGRFRSEMLAAREGATEWKPVWQLGSAFARAKIGARRERRGWVPAAIWTVIAAAVFAAVWAASKVAPIAVIGLAGWAVFGLLIYFVPTMVACGREHRNAAAIFALNFFLGWSVIGWVVALVWSLAVSPPACTSSAR